MSASTTISASTSTSPLGIIAGGGPLPLTIAKAAVAAGRSVFVCALEDMADPALEKYPHSWVTFGSIGRILKCLANAECVEVIMIGHVTRPRKSKVIPDLGALKNAAALLKALRGGDNHLLSGLADFLETKNYKVVGAHQIVPTLLIGDGPIGTLTAPNDHLKDIAKGFRVVEALGELDVGQAAVVCRGHVLAVEAAEGTDAMLQRVADLRAKNGAMHSGGVLIKMPKPGQDMRVDLPAIGSQTARLTANADLAGIVVQAGGILCPDPIELKQLADKLGIYVEGKVPSEVHAASVT